MFDDEERKIVSSLALRNPFTPTKDLLPLVEQATGKSCSASTLNRELYQRSSPRVCLKKPNVSSSEKNLDRLYEMQLGFKGKFNSVLKPPLGFDLGLFTHF